MPKGRMLNKKISYDEKVALLSLPATLLYTWLIPHLDVAGRFFGSANVIKGHVTPFIKELNVRQIQACLCEMVDIGLIIMYSGESLEKNKINKNINNQHKYIEFKGFMKNQKVNKDKEALSIIPPSTPDKLLSRTGESQPKVKQSKVKVNISSQIENLLMCFEGSLKEKIEKYLENNALKNRSKRLSDGRRRTLLLELTNSRETCADDKVFLEAVEATLKYEACNIGYINAVVKNKKTR